MALVETVDLPLTARARRTSSLDQALRNPDDVAPRRQSVVERARNLPERLYSILGTAIDSDEGMREPLPPTSAQPVRRRLSIVEQAKKLTAEKRTSIIGALTDDSPDVPEEAEHLGGPSPQPPVDADRAQETSPRRLSVVQARNLSLQQEYGDAQPPTLRRQSLNEQPQTASRRLSVTHVRSLTEMTADSEMQSQSMVGAEGIPSTPRRESTLAQSPHPDSGAEKPQSTTVSGNQPLMSPTDDPPLPGSNSLVKPGANANRRRNSIFNHQEAARVKSAAVGSPNARSAGRRHSTVCTNSQSASVEVRRQSLQVMGTGADGAKPVSDAGEKCQKQAGMDRFLAYCVGAGSAQAAWSEEDTNSANVTESRRAGLVLGLGLTSAKLVNDYFTNKEAAKGAARKRAMSRSESVPGLPADRHKARRGTTGTTKRGGALLRASIVERRRVMSVSGSIEASPSLRRKSERSRSLSCKPASDVGASPDAGSARRSVRKRRASVGDLLGGDAVVGRQVRKHTASENDLQSVAKRAISGDEARSLSARRKNTISGENPPRAKARSGSLSVQRRKNTISGENPPRAKERSGSLSVQRRKNTISGENPPRAKARSGSLSVQRRKNTISGENPPRAMARSGSLSVQRRKNTISGGSPRRTKARSGSLAVQRRKNTLSESPFARPVRDNSDSEEDDSDSDNGDEPDAPSSQRRGSAVLQRTMSLLAERRAKRRAQTLPHNAINEETLARNLAAERKAKRKEMAEMMRLSTQQTIRKMQRTNTTDVVDIAGIGDFIQRELLGPKEQPDTSARLERWRQEAQERVQATAVKTLQIETTTDSFPSASPSPSCAQTQTHKDSVPCSPSSPASGPHDCENDLSLDPVLNQDTDLSPVCTADVRAPSSSQQDKCDLNLVPAASLRTPPPSSPHDNSDLNLVSVAACDSNLVSVAAPLPTPPCASKPGDIDLSLIVTKIGPACNPVSPSKDGRGPKHRRHSVHGSATGAETTTLSGRRNSAGTVAPAVKGHGDRRNSLCRLIALCGGKAEEPVKPVETAPPCAVASDVGDSGEAGNAGDTGDAGDSGDAGDAENIRLATATDTGISVQNCGASVIVTQPNDAVPLSPRPQQTPSPRGDQLLSVRARDATSPLSGARRTSMASSSPIPERRVSVLSLHRASKLHGATADERRRSVLYDGAAEEEVDSRVSVGRESLLDENLFNGACEISPPETKVDIVSSQQKAPDVIAAREQPVYAICPNLDEGFRRKFLSNIPRPAELRRLCAPRKRNVTEPKKFFSVQPGGSFIPTSDSCTNQPCAARLVLPPPGPQKAAIHTWLANRQGASAGEMARIQPTRLVMQCHPQRNASDLRFAGPT